MDCGTNRQRMKNLDFARRYLYGLASGRFQGTLPQIGQPWPDGRLAMERAGRPGVKRRRITHLTLLLRTNDLILLSYVESLLAGAGVPMVVLDQNISAIEGSIGIFPRRVMVGDEHIWDARRILVEAGLSAELAPVDGS